MPQIIPGPSTQSGFIKDCGKDVARCVVEELGSDALLDGRPIRVVFDPEDEEKLSLGEGMSMTGQVLSAVWLHDQRPDVRSGAELIVMGRKYHIKRGFPILQSGCLCYAELDDCGEC